MTDWENRILYGFVKRVRAREHGDLQNKPLLLRSLNLFPDFEDASADEKEEYLEAAEFLAEKGLFKLRWENHAKGERLKTLTCTNLEKLFAYAGFKTPSKIVSDVRAALLSFCKEAGVYAPFLNFIAENADSSDITLNIDAKEASDFALLVSRLSKNEEALLSTRAFSVLLYRDSKRLERILNIFSPLAKKAQKNGILCPPLDLLERSFPETLAAGNMVFESKEMSIKIENGIIAGVPLQTALAIRTVRALSNTASPKCLTIENKETFYALSKTSNFDCILYTGGYPNRAVCVLLKLLSGSGFSFFHAGDLDPSGIMILQSVMENTVSPVTPFFMDENTFERYLQFARPLPDAAFTAAKKVRPETLALPGIERLLRRMLETRLGVEQEIIDYRL